MMKKYKNNLILILILIICLWCSLIFCLSAMNSSESNGASKGIIKEVLKNTYIALNIGENKLSDSDFEMAAHIVNAPLRKVMHASVYFVLAILIIIFIVNNSNNKKYFKSLLITILICFTFACLDEYHQTLVSGRTGRFSDVIIDSTGALVGTLIYGTYYLIYNKGYDAKIDLINKEKRNKDGKRKKENKN